jgi:hypothetical protein
MSVASRSGHGNPAGLQSPPVPSELDAVTLRQNVPPGVMAKRGI